jgi:uroporphyrinogen decarboxylase
MTSVERISHILKRKPVDRIGLYEHFWGDTRKKWATDGYLGEHEDPHDHFGFDMQTCWAFNFTADLDYVPEVIEETEETIVKRDGNGAIMRTHKLHNTTPEHIDFAVKERTAWNEMIKPKLTPDRRRINFDAYRDARDAARKANRFFCWSGVNVFELMHPVCGHEHMLVGMALDPDWVKDMTATFAERTIELMEILFTEEGKPDGIWFYEDMGFKERPFISPAMYRELIQPAHTRTINFAKSMGLPVTMHSCGYIEPLLPMMIEAGIDCLQVIEIKAGMDLLKLHAEFGDRLSYMGGIDVRKLYTNDIAIVDEELMTKIPTVKEGFGYVLHSDHSIPDTVAYNTYKHFVERGMELGTY